MKAFGEEERGAQCITGGHPAVQAWSSVTKRWFKASLRLPDRTGVTPQDRSLIADGPNCTFGQSRNLWERRDEVGNNPPLCE